MKSKLLLYFFFPVMIILVVFTFALTSPSPHTGSAISSVQASHVSGGKTVDQVVNTLAALGATRNGPLGQNWVWNEIQADGVTIVYGYLCHAHQAYWRASRTARGHWKTVPENAAARAIDAGQVGKAYAILGG